MTRLFLAAIAAAMLSGCASMLDNAYDEQARRQCEQGSRAGARGACIDRVEQDRRDRD